MSFGLENYVNNKGSAPVLLFFDSFTARYQEKGERGFQQFLARLYESTGRAIAVTTASALALIKMLKVFG